MEIDNDFNPDIVDIAWQIINMDRMIKQQALDIERLKRIESEYYVLLDSSLKHSQDMIGNTLKVLLSPGVAQAFLSQKEEQDKTETNTKQANNMAETLIINGVDFELLENQRVILNGLLFHLRDELGVAMPEELEALEGVLFMLDRWSDLREAAK